MRCEQELCVHWAGDGCVCSVFDLTPEHGTYCECRDCVDAAVAPTEDGEPK